MTHDHVPVPRTPEAYPEAVVWSLRKGGRIAEARVRTDPGGRELRIYVNGEFLWSDRRDIDALAAQKRLDFLDRGWSA